MIYLEECHQSEIVQWARETLLNLPNDINNFEAAAQFWVNTIYDTFRQPNDDTVFALFRVFRISRHDEIPDGFGASPDVPYWLTLMGSAGDEPAWCDPYKSKNHHVIPIDNNLSLMFITVFKQLGFEFEDIAAIEESLNTYRNQWTDHFFHITHALGSPYIPDQDTFVVPYHIKSVIGIASPFRSGAFAIVMGFTKSHINPEQAEKFAGLSPFMFTSLAQYDAVQLWE